MLVAPSRLERDRIRVFRLRRVCLCDTQALHAGGPLRSGNLLRQVWLRHTLAPLPAAPLRLERDQVRLNILCQMCPCDTHRCCMLAAPWRLEPVDSDCTSYAMCACDAHRRRILQHPRPECVRQRLHLSRQVCLRHTQAMHAGDLGGLRDLHRFYLSDHVCLVTHTCAACSQRRRGLERDRHRLYLLDQVCLVTHTRCILAAPRVCLVTHTRRMLAAPSRS